MTYSRPPATTTWSDIGRNAPDSATVAPDAGFRSATVSPVCAYSRSWARMSRFGAVT